MARLILLTLLALVVLRLLWRALQAVFEGMGYRPPAARGSSVGLVRDPVCGMFVVPSNALTSGSGANTRYFCSEKCRQDYGHRSNTEDTLKQSRSESERTQGPLRHG